MLLSLCLLIVPFCSRKQIYEFTDWHWITITACVYMYFIFPSVKTKWLKKLLHECACHFHHLYCASFFLHHATFCVLATSFSTLFAFVALYFDTVLWSALACSSYYMLCYMLGTVSADVPFHIFALLHAPLFGVPVCLAMYCPSSVFVFYVAYDVKIFVVFILSSKAL